MFDNANAGEVAARVTKILRIGLTAILRKIIANLAGGICPPTAQDVAASDFNRGNPLSY